MPLLTSGEMVGAIAMTEPDAGSDLQGIRTKAKRDGENGDFILNGSKVGHYHLHILICGFIKVVCFEFELYLKLIDLNFSTIIIMMYS